MRRYTPVHEDVRQRHSRKHRLRRDSCVWIDIVDLARRGFFRPGLHEGQAELLSEECGEWAGFTAIAVVAKWDDGVMRIDAPSGRRLAGMLTLDWPRATEIAVARVETPPVGFKWLFTCPGLPSNPACRRLVRQLYLPSSPPGVAAFWGCRHCWRLVYSDYRRGRDLHSARLERLDDLDALEQDLKRLREVTLRGLDDD
jgi:hypothetical protein